MGLKVYKAIADTLTAPELAVVVIPARLVAATLEQCADKGVKAAIVITGGFAEAGPDGERLQDELAQVIRQTGLRVIGPNCQGVNMPHEPMCASWPLITTPGRIAFASQSGTVGAAFLDLAAAEAPGGERLRVPGQPGGRGRGRGARCISTRTPTPRSSPSISKG